MTLPYFTPRPPSQRRVVKRIDPNYTKRSFWAPFDPFATAPPVLYLSEAGAAQARDRIRDLKRRERTRVIEVSIYWRLR